MAKPNNDYNLKQNELNSKNNNNLGITSFCNFRKKGFTLIEIMAIIILLSVISIIIYPVINNTISKSEDDLYDQQIEELVRLSNAWVAGNAIDLVPKEGFTYDLTFEELATQGYIVEKDIINPKTGEVFPGCMKVTYNSVDSNYNVSYDEACEAETGDVTPIINLVVDEGVINSAGYAVRDFNVKVLGSNIASYKYCTGTRECEPIVSVNGNSGNIAITNEGITYVCVIGKKGSKTTKKLCKSYKLDKSDFVMGELVIDGTLGENGWYTSDVKLSVRDVEGVTSKLNINSITENTKGTEVILTSTSKSGKTGTKKYTVKVDKTAPVAGTLNVIGTKGGNGWFLSDVVFIVNNGSDNLSGHASTTSTHTSITSNTTGTEVIVTTKDKAGNTSTRSYVIKVNKSIPAAGELVIDGTLGDNGWYTSDVNLSVKDEVGVTSTLNINKIDYDTAGTEIIMTSINNLTGASKTTKYTIKVDKTKPIVGELVISGVKGDNDWYKGNVTFSVKNGSDSMSGHSKTTSSITSITKDTKGTKVVVTTKDKAGNTNTKEYIVKMDKTAPVAGTLTISGTKGSGDWYLSDVTLKVNDGSDATSGHDTTTTSINSITTNTNGTEVIVTTKDKAGNQATRKYIIKVNKDKPQAGTLVIDGTRGENGWYVSNVKLSVSDTAGITSTLNITKITSDTKGTEVTMTSKNNTTGAVKVTKYTVKVDKTKPTIGKLVINGTEGNNGWYKSNVTFSVTNGSDTLSGHATTTSSISSITKDTKGTKVILTTKDKAGNITTKEYTIKMDKTAPTTPTSMNFVFGNWSQYTDNTWTNQSIYAASTTSNPGPSGSSDTTSGLWKYQISTDNVNWVDYNYTASGIYLMSTDGVHTRYFRAVDNAGNVSSIISRTAKVDKTAPTVPTVTYNSGSNSCSWKNNYNLTLNSSDSLSGVRVYQVDWTGDSASNSDVASNFIPWNGYSSCNNRFRAVDNAGNASEWTGVHHIHMDTEKPVHTNWWWGTVDANIAQLYIQATDNVGISRVQCPTSTQSGGYGNWRWYDAVWDSSQNAYRCDIKPADFGHYAQTYKTHLYIYDHAGNGGYYDETSAYINKKLYEIVSTNSSCTSYTANYSNTDTNYTTLNLNSGCTSAQIDLILYNAIKKGDIIKVTYSVTRTGSYYMSILDNQHINNNGGISCDPLCSTQYFKYYISSSGISKTTQTVTALYDTDFYKIGIVKNTYDYTASFKIYDITINGVKVY